MGRGAARRRRHGAGAGPGRAARRLPARIRAALERAVPHRGPHRAGPLLPRLHGPPHACGRSAAAHRPASGSAPRHGAPHAGRSRSARGVGAQADRAPPPGAARKRRAHGAEADRRARRAHGMGHHRGHRGQRPAACRVSEVTMPLPSTSPVSLPAIAPGAAPASPASPAGDDTPFAKLLSKQQDTTADAAGDADTAEADQLPAAKRSGVRVASKATPTHASPTKSEHAAGGAKPGDIEAGSDGRTDKPRDADARAGTPPADPALATWLAAVPRPAATASDTSATPVDGAKSLRAGV